MMKPIHLRAVSTVVLVIVSMSAFAGKVEDGVRDIQKRWAEITYNVVGKDEKNVRYKTLESDAESLARAHPGRPEPLIWEGIVLSTHAGVSGGLSALGKVKDARKLLEQAIEIDEEALDGSAHTSLGSLYYQVPGWPLAFGSDEKAEKHLKRALEINPDGIDPNYFYGDYLYQQKRYEEAAGALAHALAAPDRADRPLADTGRRREIRTLMDKVKEAR